MVINNDIKLIITEIAYNRIGFLIEEYEAEICAKDYTYGYKYHIRFILCEYEADTLSELYSLMKNGEIISPDHPMHKKLLEGIYLAEYMDKEMDILKSGIIIDGNNVFVDKDPIYENKQKIETKTVVPVVKNKKRRIYI